MGIKMQAPEDCGGFCYEGVALDMDANGVVALDAPSPAMLDVMRSHGFTDIKKAEEAPAKKTRQKAE